MKRFLSSPRLTAAVRSAVPVAALLLAASLAPAAHATEVPLSGDTFVTTARPGTNFGTLANIDIGSGNTGLVQFDLTTLPAGVTASQISKATLTVFINRIFVDGTVNVASVTSAWNEYTVTQSTIPTIGATITSFSATTTGVYVSVDVTAQVQSWVTTPASNNGFAFTSTAGYVLLDSKENDETSHNPHLDITITSMGATGATGPTGPQGIQGIPGNTGVQGINGATGTQGINGVTGAVGATGSIGLTGATGAQGNTGAIGVTGAQGNTGLLGATGAQGNTGLVGATGAAGNTGGTGAQGVSGTTGAVGATGAQGNTGIAGATGAQGNTGAVGVTGAQGNTGLIGATGAQGNTGVTGAQGVTGATGTISYEGSWSNSTAYPVNSVVSYNGSSYVAILANTGQTPTNTTYWQLIAVAGATGAQGIQGVQGNTGIVGTTGAQGIQGVTGVVGATGSQGNTGVTGPTGSQGNTGFTGATGTGFATGTASAQIYITQNTTFLPAPEPVTGDITITPAGVVSIGAGKVTGSMVATGASGITASNLNTTGTASSTTYLNGNFAWATPPAPVTFGIGHFHPNSAVENYLNPFENLALGTVVTGSTLFVPQSSCTLNIAITDYYASVTTTWQLYTVAPSFSAEAGTPTAITTGTNNCTTSPSTTATASCTLSVAVTAGVPITLGHLAAADSAFHAFITSTTCQ